MPRASPALDFSPVLNNIVPMNAGALFLLAMIVPVLLAAVLLIPPYLGIFGAAYIIYTPAEGASPLSDKWLDVFYVINVYNKLFMHWLNAKSVSFLYYTLPVVALPSLSTFISIWMTSKLSRKLVDVFYDVGGPRN